MAKTIAEEKFPISRQVFPDKEAALAYFSQNPFKAELIAELPEEVEISAYTQGEFWIYVEARTFLRQLLLKLSSYYAHLLLIGR